jgi:hypothetical protein
MRKTSTVALSGMALAGILALSPIAHATEPITLTNDQMDTATAGASLLIGPFAVAGIAFTDQNNVNLSIKVGKIEFEAHNIELTSTGPGGV